jgi:hypothetical protein
MLEAHNVVVMETTMDLDFRHELLFRSGFCEGSLGDNLGGRHSLSLKVSEFIALSETTFTKELASEVFLDAYVSIELYDFLFNDNLGIILLVLRRLSSLLWLLHCFSLVFTSLL